MNTINQIKKLLGMEVKLERAKLDNGTEVEADSFEAGAEIFIVSEDGNVPLPKGDYMMEDGRMLVIEEDGIIGEVKDAEAPEGEEAPAQEEMSDTVTRAEFEELKAAVMALADAVTMKAETPAPAPVEMAKEEPEAEPVKHSPENKEATKAVKFQYGKPQTTESRVFELLSKN